MPAYPVEYESDYVAQRSRLTTFFRAPLVIPHLFVGMAYGIALTFTLLLAWFAVVFTGRYPAGLYSFNASVLRWGTQLGGFMLLATDRFPPFGLDGSDYPVRVRIGEPQAEYSRVKAFFRLILMLPWTIVVGVYSYVTMFASIGAWFAIVVTGRQPELLQRGINFYLAPSAKVNAFGLLLTDAWPPFEPETELEPRATGSVLPPASPPAGPEIGVAGGGGGPRNG